MSLKANKAALQGISIAIVVRNFHFNLMVGRKVHTRNPRENRAPDRNWGFR
jgi:hypothetical protein